MPPRSVSIIDNGSVLFNSATIIPLPHYFIPGKDQPDIISWSFYQESAGIWNPPNATTATVPPEQVY